jgi:hypothetical protein
MIMKNRLLSILLLFIVFLLLLAGCGPSQTEAEPAQPGALPTIRGLEDAPPNPPTKPSDYPAPEANLPPTPTLDPDYPAPTPWPVIDPYPGGLVWIIRPVGIQCEDGTAPGYSDLTEVESTLTAAGVKVVAAEMTEMVVASSCGSPTSAHFRVQIAAEDLQTALSLDWIRE